jgi:hypothetical protein
MAQQRGYAADPTDTGPYPPRRVDRLIDRIEGLPGPSWVAHAVAAIAVGLVANAAGWVDGFLKPDQYDPLLTSLVPFLVGSLAAIHYLDWAAARAWTVFRPATTGGIALAGLYINAISDPASFENPAIAGIWAVFVVLGVACSLAPLYGMHVKIAAETRRRLSDVNGRLDRALEGLHRRADTGDLADADRAFVVPLFGIHRLIAAEKSRRSEGVNALLDKALGDLHSRVEQGELSDAGAVNSHISSLLAEREVVARTSSWPWAPETLRGFVTAIVLPVGLWMVYRVLDQTLL